MKKLLLTLVCLILFNSCQKEKEIKIEGPKPHTPLVRDVELEKWKESLKKESYTIETAKTPNPFISPKTYKVLAQKEETIPLELVGIIDRKGQKMALLQDSARKGYIVKRGDRLGHSYIKEIGNDYLIIEETVENIFGVKTKRLRKITLKKERL